METIVGTMTGAEFVSAVNSNFQSLDTINAATFMDDFTGGSITNSSPLGLATAGSGASYDGTGASESGHPGIGTLSTGTTTTGSAAILSKSQSLVVFGADAWTLRCIFRVPTASDGTDTFTVRVGFGDSTTAADGTDGVFLRYTHSVNSGKFQCVTRSNSTETATDSGVTLVAGTWYRVDISVNAAGTSVVFSLKSGTGAASTVATNTTNIPTTSARATGVMCGILKSAGTTARTLDLDLVEATVTFGTTR